MNQENLEGILSGGNIILDEEMVNQLKQMVISDDQNDFNLACEILKQLDFNNSNNCQYYTDILYILVNKIKGLHGQNS